MIHENKDRHKTVSCVETDPTLHCKNDFSNKDHWSIFNKKILFQSFCSKMSCLFHWYEFVLNRCFISYFFNQLNIVHFYTSKTHNNKSIAVKKNSLSETANTCYMKHEHEKQIVCTEFVLN